MQKVSGTLIHELGSPRATRERFTLARRPLKLLHIFIVALCTTSLSHAAPISKSATHVHSKGAASALPPALKEIEATYAKAGTLVAHFDQVNDSAAMHMKKSSSGNIAIKRPDKLRWQTLSPDANILVSDGKHAWFYTPPFDESEHGQYSEYPASAIQSKLASALLSGEFSAAKDLKIQQTSDHEFHLSPKTGTAGTVQEAWIEIDPAKKVITRVQLLHRDGNRSDIHLSDIKLGEKLGDEVFVFKAPPNTDRVEE